MSDKLNLVVQFTALDGLSGSLKSMIGLGKSGSEALKSIGTEGRKARGELATMEKDLKQMNQQLLEVKDRMAGGGLSSGLVLAERELKLAIEETNAKIARQKTLVETNAAAFKRAAALGAISARTAQIETRADTLKSAGFHGLMGASIFLAPLGLAIHEARDYEREMARIDGLGLGKGVVEHADRFARGAHIIGNSTRDMAHAYGDAMAIFKNTHEADFVAPLIGRMKFANQALYGEAEGGEHDSALMSLMKTIEFRGGTKSEAAFQHQADFAQKVVNASRGRVDGNEMLNAMKTGGILAKTMSDKAFYLNSEPLVQEYGGHRFGTALSALYANLAQGHGSISSQQELLRLGLLDRSKVEFNKMGMLKKTLPGASDISVLRDDGALAYLDKVLLPAFAKKGITTDNAIIEELGRIFSNKGASSLMTSVYQQREKLRAQSEANAQALGIDGSVNVARNTFAGKSVDLNAKWHSFLEVAAKRGGLLDMAIGGVETLTGALDGLTSFANRHPNAFRFIVMATTSLVGMRLGVSAAKLAFGGLLGPVGKLWGIWSKYKLAGNIADAFPKVAKAFDLVRGAALMLGRGFMAAGALMEANPMVLAITAVGVAVGVLAFVVYKNWGKISGYFREHWTRIRNLFLTGLVIFAPFIAALVWLGAKVYNNWDKVSAAFSHGWDAIKHGFGEGIDWVKAKWDAFTTWLSGTRLGKIVQFGADIATGAANGIKRFGGRAIDAAGNLADKVGGGFANQLQIRSPSRVFMAYGGHIASGLAIGLERSGHHPVHSMKRMAAAVAGAGAMTLAPAAHARAPAPMRGGDHYEIHVHVGAGADGKAMAREIHAELDRLARQKRHSSYEDEF